MCRSIYSGNHSLKINKEHNSFCTDDTTDNKHHMFRNLHQRVIYGCKSQTTYHPDVDRKGLVSPLKDLFKVQQSNIPANLNYSSSYAQTLSSLSGDRGL